VNKKIIYYLPVLLLLSGTVCYAQKIKSEDISYFVNRLPAASLDRSVKNYQVTVEAAYEARNQEALKAYEKEKRDALQKYNAEMAAYPALVKTAEDNYAKELAEYNKKSFGKKILEKSLDGGQKPVKQLPVHPYLAMVDRPALQSSYDYSALANTYINLEGYQNDPQHALKITVVMYGFDHTAPRTMDEQSSTVSLGGSNNGVGKSTYYHTEFSYRHPMTVKVATPDGKEIMNVTPPELNSYKIYKSAATDRATRINSELLIKTSEEKVLQENLKFINNMLNDQFGYSKVKRMATLYYIKNGDEAYADLTTAFNEASSGLLMMQQDPTGGKTHLDKACGLWKTALDQADISNKKARINKDIAIAVSFDLLESYYASGNATAGQSVLDKLNTYSLSSSERKTKYDYDVLFAELKTRSTN
jgi:hypothetical protein